MENYDKKDIFDKVNEEQRAAIMHENGPLLIVAGAGTGKTTVITKRIAYLVGEGKARSDEILLLTFTEKAAGEMEDRALKILPYGSFDLWIHTFHGFAERILRDHGLEIGLDTGFKLLDQTAQWILIKKNLHRFDLDYYKPLGNPNKFIMELIKHFSRLKDEDIEPKEYLDYANGIFSLSFPAEAERRGRESTVSGSKSFVERRGSPSLATLAGDDNKKENDEAEASRIRELAHAYDVYNQLLIENSHLDFGDLIRFLLRLFRERPNVLAHYREKFKFVMVDEFQDTNWAQYELVKMLAAPKDNLMVVGDDDQSIYKFRGASLSNIMQFKDDYKDAREVVLVKNYRSGQAILDAAYSFIKHNDPNRLEVKLGIDKRIISGKGEYSEISHNLYADENAEIEGIIAQIGVLRDAGADWKEMAILFRSNGAAEKMAEGLRRYQIPFVFYSSRGLYYKPVVLDCLAYLKLLDDYHESAAVYRVLNMDQFRVSQEDIAELGKFAKAKYLSLFSALKSGGAQKAVGENSKVNIAKLITMTERHADLAKKEPASKVFIAFVHESGLLAGKDFDKDREYFSLLNQLYSRIKKFEEAENGAMLKDFLDLIALEMEAGETGSLAVEAEDEDVVKVMTVHASKGLEFSHVFLPGLVDKRFPTISRQEKIGIPDALVREKLPVGKELHLEEERRLFYVALTRAKKTVHLSSAEDYGGAKAKKPSIFLGEMGIEQGIKIESVGASVALLQDMEMSQNAPIRQPCKFVLPKRFSFSQIEAYLNCPYQYKLAFVLKIPTPEKPAMNFGRVMHATLREFLVPNIVVQQSLFPVSVAKKRGLDELMAIYRKHWRDEGYDSAAEMEKYRNKGIKALEYFHAGLEREGWPEVSYLEKGFVVPIAGYNFRGNIDRVDRLPGGGVEVVDYKTGRPKEKLDYGNKRQLLIYKIALEEGFDTRVEKLTFYYLEDGSSISFEADDKLVGKLKEEVKSTIDEMATGCFDPKPGILCAYCDFRAICEFKAK